MPPLPPSATSTITAGAPVVNNVQYQPTGVILVATAQNYYTLGGRFKLQYLQIGRR